MPCYFSNFLRLIISIAELLARKSNKQYESGKKAAASELRKSEMRIEMIQKLVIVGVAEARATPTNTWKILYFYGMDARVFIKSENTKS